MDNLGEFLTKNKELLGRYQDNLDGKTKRKEELLEEKKKISFELGQLNAKISGLLGAKFFLNNYDSILKEHQMRIKHFAFGSLLLMETALVLISITLASLPVFLLGSVFCNIMVAIYCAEKYHYNTRKDRRLKQEQGDINTVEKEYQESIELRETYNYNIGVINGNLEVLNSDIERLVKDIDNLSYYIGYFKEQNFGDTLGYNQGELDIKYIGEEEKEHGKII